MPFFSHEEDSKLLEQCLRLRDVQVLGTRNFPVTRVVPRLAQEEDKAPASPTSDAADRGSRHCREARELFLAAQGQSRWLLPPQETLEAEVASSDPGEKRLGFNPKVLDLRRQEFFEYCYLLPKENEHSETQEKEKQEESDKNEQPNWKEGENLTYISLL